MKYELIKIELIKIERGGYIETTSCSSQYSYYINYKCSLGIFDNRDIALSTKILLENKKENSDVKYEIREKGE